MNIQIQTNDKATNQISAAPIQLTRRLPPQQHQALFFECSARSGSNLQEVMTEMAR